MLKFVESIKFIHFSKMNAVVIPAHIEDAKEKVKFARTTVDLNKKSEVGFIKLFEIMCRSPRPEVSASVMADILLTRSNEEQHYFINAVLGGFKLLADYFNFDTYRTDGRNKEAFEIINSIINLSTPTGCDTYYKFGAVQLMMADTLDELKNDSSLAIDQIFHCSLDKSTVASTFYSAFRSQHPIHQQNITGTLMALFHLLESQVEQSCLLNKISHINVYNKPLAYC